MGHCEVLPPLCPLQAEMVVVGSQQGHPCRYGQEPFFMVFQPALTPYKFGFLIHAIKPQVHMKWSCRTILHKALSWWDVVFRGAPVDLPSTKVPVAACLWRMWLTVAPMRPTHVTSNSILLQALMGKYKHFMPNIYIGVGRDIIRTISENWEKYAIVDSNLPQCEGRFREMTT